MRKRGEFRRLSWLFIRVRESFCRTGAVRRFVPLEWCQEVSYSHKLKSPESWLLSYEFYGCQGKQWQWLTPIAQNLIAEYAKFSFTFIKNSIYSSVCLCFFTPSALSKRFFRLCHSGQLGGWKSSHVTLDRLWQAVQPLNLTLFEMFAMSHSQCIAYCANLKIDRKRRPP